MRMILFCAVLLWACGTQEQPHQSPQNTPGAPTPIDRAGWPATLKIGANSHLTKSQNPEGYNGFLKYLQERTGLPTELVMADGYEDLANRFLAQEIDIADLTPFNYVKIKEKEPKVTLLARQIATGTSTYSAYFITREENRISSLFDLRGKSLALVDRLSTSGYLLPMGSLLEAGIDPKKELGKMEFLGTHEAVIEAVQSGKFDAGVVWSGALDETNSDKLFIFYKSIRIPYDAYAARSGLPDSLSKVVQEALFSLSTRTPEGRAILTPMPSHLNGFVSAEDRDYDGIRAVEARVKSWTVGAGN